jgi:hypothetical protein
MTSDGTGGRLRISPPARPPALQFPRGRRLASRDIPYDEWEVLFRERLQVERDLLTPPTTATRLGRGMPPGDIGSRSVYAPHLMALRGTCTTSTCACC